MIEEMAKKYLEMDGPCYSVEDYLLGLGVLVNPSILRGSQLLGDSTANVGPVRGQFGNELVRVTVTLRHIKG